MVGSPAFVVTDPIRVTVPAREDFVTVLRAVTTAVAGRLPMPFDDVADLRLLVDEACARLLALGAGPLCLRMDLCALSGGFEVVVWSDATTIDPWPPVDLDDSLGWRVLIALSDELTFERRAGGPAIRILKRSFGSGGGR